uniref:NADH dehydrogenase subunit K n=1 Tax=Striga asiatica TaxID=4170 RepID=UPI00220F780F|nr:NADH dehydrogenase subunit K [Striga asiatica]UXL88433.1 NADH dehydrogenase subunit K [Striga asiatica]
MDVYLTGSPPKPEAVIDALRKKVSREIYEDRIRSQQANRCFTTNHKFRVGRRMEIMIKGSSTNCHLLPRSLRKPLPNRKLLAN